MTNAANPSRFPVLAYLLLAVIAGLLCASILTFSSHPTKFADIFKSHSLHDLLVGKTTHETEKLFEDQLVLQEPAVGFWGGLRFALFHTGNSGVLIGKQQWLFSTEEFQDYPEGRAELQHKLDVISQVDLLLRQHGVQLAVLMVPAKARIYANKLNGEHLPAGKSRLYQGFRKQLMARGIYAPDLVQPFRKHRAKVPLFMRTDTHWTPQGAQLAADVLAAALHQDCAALTLPAATFTTSSSPQELYDGDLTKFVPTGPLQPWIGIPPEPLQRSATVKVENEQAPTDALFADETLPVVLVGTSYSKHPQWNFEGALKMALHSDVLNVADEGGGPMKPMAAYLANADFVNHAPKLVIWEIPERFLAKSYPEVQFTFPSLNATATNASLKTGCLANPPLQRGTK